MTDPLPGGAEVTDGPVPDAGPSAAPRPRHPLLRYDPDAILRRLSFSSSMEYVLGDAPGANSDGSLIFDDAGVQYRLRFYTRTQGYVLIRADVEAALRGDVDTTSPEPVRHPNFWNVTSAVVCTIEMPRPDATPVQRGIATRRFNRWLAGREERLARERERERQREEEMREAQRKYRAAEQAAEATLRRYLTPKQRETVKRGYFDVVGSAGTNFRIRTEGSVSGNVWWYKNGKKMGQLCAHSDTYSNGMPVQLPAADHWIAQMLEIVTDEPRWLKIAHHLDGTMHPAHRAKYDADDEED